MAGLLGAAVAPAAPAAPTAAPRGWTRPARSSCGAVADDPAADADQPPEAAPPVPAAPPPDAAAAPAIAAAPAAAAAAPALVPPPCDPVDCGGGPPARRSAGLPASPWPSTVRAARNSLATSGGADVPVARRGGSGSGRPWRRRRPVARRVAANGLIGVTGLRRLLEWRRRLGPRIARGRGTGHDARQPSGRRSAPSRVVRRLRARVPPRVGPNPGRPGRPGTRSTGSRPPGERARAARVATRRSIDGGGRGSSTDRRDRPRTRRTDKPGHRPCWAALAQSSGR